MSGEADSDLSRQRDTVFQEIGRNVVMFQDIERILKNLLNRGRITATVSQLKAWNGKAPAPYAKRMLGELIEPVINRHLSPGDEGGPTLPEGNETAMGFEFRVELSEEERADFRVRLEEMVNQRNELIHHLLDWLRLDTVENCRSAVQRLQRQRGEIEPLHREIEGIWESFLRVLSPKMVAALTAKVFEERGDHGSGFTPRR